MLFAQKLQKLMEQKGLSNYQLAKDLDVHPSTVANWLDGKEPRRKTLLQLMGYFDVTLDYLLGNYDDDVILVPLTDDNAPDPPYSDRIANALKNRSMHVDEKTSPYNYFYIEALGRLHTSKIPYRILKEISGAYEVPISVLLDQPNAPLFDVPDCGFDQLVSLEMQKMNEEEKAKNQKLEKILAEIETDIRKIMSMPPDEPHTLEELAQMLVKYTANYSKEERQKVLALITDKLNSRND